MSKTISLCMITKNEERTIGRCLESIYDVVDEIIIVDTGSTDKTKEICSKYTDKIYDFEWIYDFSAARNYAIQFATSDYILWLDSDDMIKPSDNQEFKRLKKQMDGSVDLYFMYYDYRHDENGNSIYSFSNERMFKNFKGIKWECIIHEVLRFGTTVDKIEKTNIRVTHTSNHDNTNKYVDFFTLNEERGHEFIPRESYFFATELFKHDLDDKCIFRCNEVISNPVGITQFELASVHSMLGQIYKRQNRYNEAINNLILATTIHQPLPMLYYEIAECYRTLFRFDHAIFYYRSIIEDIMFPERFSNDSVYTNFKSDMYTFKVKSLLSLIVIYYYDLKDIVKSIEYNDLLLTIDPNNESGLYNKEFFNNLLNKGF